MTPGLPVWVTITSRDSGVSLGKKSLWWSANDNYDLETCSRCSPQTRRRLRLPLVPTWHTLQVVEEEPMRKERLRFLKKMEVSILMQVPNHLSSGKGRGGRATQLLDQLIQVGLELDPPAKCKLEISRVGSTKPGVGEKSLSGKFHRPTCRWRRCRCRTGRGRSAW